MPHDWCSQPTHGLLRYRLSCVCMKGSQEAPVGHSGRTCDRDRPFSDGRTEVTRGSSVLEEVQPGAQSEV